MDSNVTDPKQALVDKIKQSTNILVTVSANPTVDQLAACLGLTLWLNKADKHATAVFSGEVPSTLEFLQPEATLEKNTDSLRDFIIALDKSKADKLRYKVEDTVVKIFITPYRTSLSADDLEFSQGDFNVDMVIALGVHAQADLDTAITAHGRILHDAAVATVTTGDNASDLGSISWHDAQASSLSELVVDLGNTLDQQQLDGQIATALLTGIVAETARFSNEKTTPQTMSISAQLMSAGANQQLVASKLEEPVTQPEKSEDTSNPDQADEAPKPQDGTLEIEHQPREEAPTEAPEGSQTEAEHTPDQPAEITDVKSTDTSEAETPEENHESRLMTEPPTMGGTLTANSRPEDVMLEPSSDPLSQPTPAEPQPLMDRPSDTEAPTEPAAELPAPQEPQPAPPDWMPPQPWLDQPAEAHEGETLEQIEQAVDSPHLKAEEPAEQSEPTTTPDLDAARDEVMKAMEATPDANPEPIQALNAQPIDLTSPAAEAPVEPLPAPTTVFDPSAFNVANDPEFTSPQPPAGFEPDASGPVDQPYTLPVPNALTPPPADPMPPTSNPNDPTAPPPVPPPLMPPGFPPSR